MGNAKLISICLTLLIMSLIMGCATTEKAYQFREFDDVGFKYGLAIRWSDYRTANSFCKKAAPGDHTPDFDRLNQFKVTSYQVKERTEQTNLSQVRQLVEIHYYKTDSFIVKKVTDHQVWQYDKKQGRWYLLTGLPHLK